MLLEISGAIVWLSGLLVLQGGSLHHQHPWWDKHGMLGVPYKTANM